MTKIVVPFREEPLREFQQDLFSGLVKFIRVGKTDDVLYSYEDGVEIECAARGGAKVRGKLLRSVEWSNSLCVSFEDDYGILQQFRVADELRDGSEALEQLE